ncbi:hypothetical protein [Geomicrobium sp. JCM 19038]|uniref:hypothetical protein n=1 Tax=Geomicrobium sp. JCM 19038 TaxID=1460635 RepID=UPI00045F30DD|nr:hypothetical protein [Geomicrobium sp. JCM 19038]GAK07813.1 hypothetical protein JCM19038_1558 [Geomicrobium sp. JCM 19038]
MKKTVPFNHGELTLDTEYVQWRVEDTFVQSATMNDLSYMKKKRPYTLPVKSMVHEGNQMIFTWALEDHLPYVALRQEDVLVRLRAAEGFIELYKYFSEQTEVETSLDLHNLVFSKEHNETKALGSMKSIHFSNKNDTEQNELPFIQKQLVYLFSPVKDKEFYEVSAEELIKKAPQNEKHIVTTILEATSLELILETVREEITKVQSQYYETQSQPAKKPRRGKRLGLLATVVIAVGAIVYAFGFAGSTEEAHVQEIEEERVTEVDEQLDTANKYVEALEYYYQGEYEEAFSLLELVKPHRSIDDSLYIELAVLTNHYENYLVENPEQVAEVAYQLHLQDRGEEILELETDHPYVLMEQHNLEDESEELLTYSQQIEEERSLNEREIQLTFYAHLALDPEEAYAFAERVEDSNYQKRALDEQIEILENQLEEEDESDIEELEEEVAQLEELRSEVS